MTAHEAARRQPGPPWTLGLGAAAGVAACSPLVGAPIAAVVLCAAPLLWYALAVENGWLRGFFVSALLLPPVAVAWGDSGPHPAAAFAIAGAVGILFRGIAWERAATLPALALFAYLGAMSLSVGLAHLYSGWTIGANSAIRLGLFGISALAYLSARIGDRTTLRVLVPAALGAAAIGGVPTTGFNSPPQPATGRNTYGSNPEWSAGPRASSSNQARLARSARSSS